MDRGQLRTGTRSVYTDRNRPAYYLLLIYTKKNKKSPFAVRFHIMYTI